MRPNEEDKSLLGRLRMEAFARGMEAGMRECWDSETCTLVSEAIDEIEQLRQQVEQFHQDWFDMYLVAMYGNPPGGWSCPERIKALQDALDDAERRHRVYRDTHDRPERPALALTTDKRQLSTTPNESAQEATS